MMTASFRWKNDHLVPGVSAGRIRVADSWLSCDGCSPHLDLHKKRFRQHVVVPAGFWEAVEKTIASVGGGCLFPRVFVDDQGIGLELRPAPEARIVTKLLGDITGDPRVNHRIKGPDIGVLHRVRERAISLGLDDVILTDGHGYVREATTGSLIWWDGQSMVLPDQEDYLLPSTTRCRVLDACEKHGISVKRVNLTVADLIQYPLWFLNAVQGISPVVSIHVADYPKEQSWPLASVPSFLPTPRSLNT